MPGGSLGRAKTAPPPPRAPFRRVRRAASGAQLTCMGITTAVSPPKAAKTATPRPLPSRHRVALLNFDQFCKIWANLNLKDLKDVLFLTQGFAADPVYGRVKCLPMMGEIKT
jgi:hypothetical protein